MLKKILAEENFVYSKALTMLYVGVGKLYHRPHICSCALPVSVTRRHLRSENIQWEMAGINNSVNDLSVWKGTLL